MGDILFAKRPPIDEGMLYVGGGHQIHWQRYGIPGGIPAVSLHGGPGFGLNENDSRYFDLDYFDLILFSQRGTGRSMPSSALAHSAPLRGVTVHDLIEDIEILRIAMRQEGMNNDQWYVAGGSWGAALATLYAGKYGQNVKELLLRGEFVPDTKGVQHLFGPDRWKNDTYEACKPYRDFLEAIPEHERKTLDELAKACHSRLFGTDATEAMKIASLFEMQNRWKSTFVPNMEFINAAQSNGPNSNPAILSLVRTFFHCISTGELGEWIRPAMIEAARNFLGPVTIFHGQNDDVCPSGLAEDVYRAFPYVRSLIRVPKCGHSMLEPPLQQRFIEVTNGWRDYETGGRTPSLQRRSLLTQPFYS